MLEEELIGTLRHLISLEDETEWVEFKRNNAKPEDIGEYLSALSNAAAIHRKDAGYLIWGVENSDRTVSGTTFKPRREKIGNQELENWLACQLSPRIDFQIHEFFFNDRPVVMFKTQPASHAPVEFKGIIYIRVGSYKKKLSDHPEKERALWALFSRVPFETGIALPNATPQQVLALIDYPGLFALMGQDLPENRATILERLEAERIILRRDDRCHDITGLGAALFAKKLSDFERLARKAIRIIIYRGVSRVMTVRERFVDKGYAVGFEDAIRFINEQLPRNEQIGQAFRKDVPMYPEIAIREIVANALIHQDFSVTGTSPLVEIFEDRIEITNPGVPLIEPLRFIDAPPLSRNEKIAALMRRMNICEERGSGIDKVITRAC